MIHRPPARPIAALTRAFPILSAHHRLTIAAHATRVGSGRIRASHRLPDFRPTAAGFAGRGRAWRKQSLSSRALLLVCDLQYGAALCVGRVYGCEIVQEPPLQRFAARNSATACFRGVAVAFAETFSGLYESGAPLDDDLRMDEESFAFGSFRL